MKSIKGASNETKEVLTQLFDLHHQNNLPQNLSEWVKGFENVDSELIGLLHDVDTGNKKFKDIEAYSSKATFSVSKLGLAFKNLATNIAIMAAIQIAVNIAATAIDNYIHRVEKAREALEESNSAYKSSTTELESLNKQLDETADKITALESDGITIVNEDEYNQLVETNEELERTIALKKVEQGLNANQSASDAANLYAEMTKNAGTPSEEHYEKLVEDGNFTPLMLDTNDASNNIDVLLGYYTQLQNKISDTKAEMDKLLNNNDEESQHQLQELQYQLEDYEYTLGDVSELITDNMNKYQEVYDGIKPKIDLGIGLTEAEQAAYDGANTALDLISQVLSSTAERLDDFVDKNNLGDSLDELFNSGKSGTELKEELNSYYPHLLAFMDQEGIELQDLIDKYTKLDEVKQSTMDAELPATISSSVQQIATQLEPQFDQLAEAYLDIFTDKGFTLDNVDNEMLENLRSIFADIEEELGVTFDPSVLNPFFDKLTNGTATAQEVQQAFNDLATSWFYGTDTLANLNDETANAIQKQLEEMGVVNAEEVVMAALTAKNEETAMSKLYLAETGRDLVNATTAEVAAFLTEQIEAGNCGQALVILELKKRLVNGTLLNTDADVSSVLTLAKAAGITSVALDTLAAAKANFESAVKSGNSLDISQTAAAYQQAKKEAESAVASFEPVKVDFDFQPTSNSTNSAGSAGKEAADEYLEAFEDELSRLQDLRDRGKITEKEYLDQLRKLYEKYFKDKKKYLDEFEKYEHEYLDGMKSLYQSVFSTIISKYDEKIDAANDAKDAAVSALEAEKDAAISALEAQKEAAEKAYQAQIDAIQIQIDSKQEIIDGIQDEIDAMRDANEERQREIDLQKAKYELERSIHQRTNLVYKSDKGFVYEADPTAVRDNQQAVEDAKLEIEISAKEKQIKLIEEEITALEKQQDAIQDMIDKSNEYYDNLIEQTEKQYDEMIKQTEAYWDAIIKSLEDYKSRYEELSDMESDAKAMADLKELCESMGITVDEVLNMSDEAFQAFRDNYTSILADIYSGNDQMTSAIADQAGRTTDQLGSYLANTQEFVDGLNALDLSSTAEGLESTASGMDKVAESSGSAAENLDKVSTSSSNAGTSVQATSESMSSLEAASSGVSSNIDAVASSLSTIPDSSKITELSGSFERLAGAIVAVSKALGIGEEDSVGGLATALSNISAIKLEGDEGGLITQFTNLKNAVSSVSSAISGGDSEGNDTSGAGGITGESEGGGASSLTGALDTLKTTSDDVLGGGESSDGTENSSGAGVIGQFGQLKQSVADVTAAIGGGEGSDDGSSSGEDDAGSLIGSLQTLQETTDDILGEPGEEGLIHKFEEFKEPIIEASEHVTGISDALEEIDGQDVECTIRVNIETTGSLPAGIASVSGTALANMNLSSETYNAKLGKAHAEGTAKTSGDWAVHNGGMSLLGELGQEIVVRNGRFFTVGDNGAQFIRLQPGDIVFNHKQTEELLKNGQITSRGKAFSDGSTGRSYADGSTMNVSTTSAIDPQKLEMYNAFNELSDKLEISNSLVGKLNDQIEKHTQIVNNIQNRNNYTQPISIQIGDINLHEVQNADNLAKTIVNRFPAMVMQEIHKR